jgi:hypothetical protein
MRKYYIFAKLATEGDFLHWTALTANTPPRRYLLIGTQYADSRENAILLFFSIHEWKYHELKTLLKQNLRTHVNIPVPSHN